MRMDHKKLSVESEDDDPTKTECCGYNILKFARLSNLIVGTALTVVCGLNIFNIFSDSNILTGFNKFLLNLFDW